MTQSAKPPVTDYLSRLPSAPASDVKRLGWRGMMKTVHSTGRLLVTNHDEPEAVILPAAEYDELMRRVERSDARADAALRELRQDFDKRLSVLQERSASDRLRAAVRGPTKLRGKVKAGTNY